MSALLDSTEAGFYGMDTDGNCSFINRAGAAMLGYTVDELIGKQMHNAVHYKHRDGTPYKLEECPIFMASQRGKSAAAEDEVFWRKDGSHIAVRVFDVTDHSGWRAPGRCRRVRGHHAAQGSPSGR